MPAWAKANSTRPEQSKPTPSFEAIERYGTPSCDDRRQQHVLLADADRRTTRRRAALPDTCTANAVILAVSARAAV